MRLRIGSDFTPRNPEPGSNHLRNLERLFFWIGVIALGCFLGVSLYSSAYQAYAEYSFEEQLSRQTASSHGFLAYLARKLFRARSAPTVESARSRTNDILQQMIYGSGAASDMKEWSPGRLRAYRNAAPPPPGSILGRLEIPSINLSVMLLQGTDDWTLDRAVGHIEGTALPGQSGNMGIAGHRDGFFRDLRKLARSDTLTLTTLQGRFEYRINTIKIVSPSDTTVLEATRTPTLTLVTCYPFYYVGAAPERYVVTAEMVKMEDAAEVAADQARTH